MEAKSDLPVYRNLVFEGGGVKGIAYGGALARLEEMGLLKSIKRVAGTSAGAITATLMAIGYSPAEISGIIAKADFSDFADDDFGFLRDFYRLIKKFGWHKGDKFQGWISDLIRDKLGKAELSFSELHTLTKTNTQLKDLYIVGSNLTKQSSEVYSYEHSPDMKIADAVRISMSIPFYFEAVVNNIKNPKSFNVFPLAKLKEVLVDGGVIRNYPINLFDHEKYLFDPENGNPYVRNTETPHLTPEQGYIFNHETIGFRLTSKDALEASLQAKEITDLKSFSMSLITFMRSMASKLHVQEDDWNRTIAIDTTGVSVTEFDLVENKIDILIQNGRKGVGNYFDWRKQQQVQPVI